MAKRVEGVTKKLLECAKEEFLLKGYENASLRAIAKKADSSKGAIYIRYPDKESLYRALVQPTIDGLCEVMKKSLEHFGELSAKEQKEQERVHADDGFIKIIDYIYEHFNEFKLLMACGENKVGQELVHKLVDLDIEYTTKFINITGSDAFESGRLTPELIHLLSSAFYSGIFEVVLHDMPKEYAVKYIQSMRKFYKAGWKTIFEGGDDN